MAKLTIGQTTRCRLIYEVLNQYFNAHNAKGNQLDGLQSSVWPQSSPFLSNPNDKCLRETVVWFPKITDDPKACTSNGWLNVVSDDGKSITTTYIGDKSESEVEIVAARYVGKDHIVFVKDATTDELVFFGVFSCSKKGNVRMYTRIAEDVNTADWQRR